LLCVRPAFSKTEMTTHETDILISGAGAAGLTLAIDLARRKVAFRIIEKAEKAFNGSRGKGIQPRSQEVFYDLGVVKQLFEIGGAYPLMREYGSNGHTDVPVMDQREPTLNEPFTTPLMVPQFMTEGVLRDRLAELGHHVQFGCELLSFEQDDQGVTAQIQNQQGIETIRAKYLVGTDGGRSFVRHVLEINFPGETLGARAVVADLSLDGLTPDFWHRWKENPRKSISLCPLRGTPLFQLQAPVPLEGDVDTSITGLTNLIAERTGRNDIVIHDIMWCSVYNMNQRLADNYRKGRVFLAGDSAHIHPPTGGQGLNTSVQDAYNLSWKLAAVLQGAPTTLLDTYEEERRPIAAVMLGLASKLLNAAKESGDMRRGRETQQLDLGYRDSSLALSSSRQSDVCPGDRAPDAPCQRNSDGQATRVFDVLQGPHWTLLGYETTGNAPVPSSDKLHVHRIGNKGDIVDHAHHIRDFYKLNGNEWVLIRPDGYIAVITDNVNDLLSYMDKVGLAH
jgi:2-polyprenyl-6-methoxyphenol hydroxylase-like FAD-dependent oxidoreductase